MSVRDQLYGRLKQLSRPTPPAAAALPGDAALKSRYLLGEVEYQCSPALLELVQRRLVESKGLGQGEEFSGDAIRARVLQLVSEMPSEPEFQALPGFDEEYRLLRQATQRFVDFVVQDVMGLGPLEVLLADPAVTEIMVNGPKVIFFEKKGLHRFSRGFMDEKHLLLVIARMLAPLGKRCDFVSPMVDARLLDGSRVNIVIPPASVEGPCITIRKFPEKPFAMADLMARGALSPKMAVFLEACVRARRNIVVAGGTGTGKTTVLNALAAYVPDHERVVVIEDTAEMQVLVPNRARLEARDANTEGKGAITIRDLLKNALRMRPDRILVGECRGAETLDMLQAMNTGHDGSMTSIHANTPRDVLSRLETMTMMAGLNLPQSAIASQIGSAVHLIVQAERLADGTRRISRLTAVDGYRDGLVGLSDIFKYQLDPGTGITGSHKACGVVPVFQDKLLRTGIEFPSDFYLE